METNKMNALKRLLVLDGTASYFGTWANKGTMKALERAGFVTIERESDGQDSSGFRFPLLVTITSAGRAAVRS